MLGLKFRKERNFKILGEKLPEKSYRTTTAAKAYYLAKSFQGNLYNCQTAIKILTSENSKA